MLLNPEKTKGMVVATRPKHQRGLPPLRLMLNSQVIEQVSEHRHLGLVDRLLSSINDSKLNGVVFFDLKKAFDLIDQQILLKR